MDFSYYCSKKREIRNNQCLPENNNYLSCDNEHDPTYCLSKLKILNKCIEIHYNHLYPGKPNTKPTK